MKLYVLCTEAHQELLEGYLRPSAIRGGFDVVVGAPDIAGELKYGTPSFNLLMRNKVELILSAIRSNMGDLFAYADADIQFFGSDVARDLRSYATENQVLWCQQDSLQGAPCAGFFLCRGDSRALALWQEVLDQITEQNDDQRKLQWMWDRGRGLIGTLPPQYWSVFWVTGGKRWEPGRPCTPPVDVRMHHANWTEGLENKRELLDTVRRLVKTRA